MAKLHLRKGKWPHDREGWLLLCADAIERDQEIASITQDSMYGVENGWIISPADAQRVRDALGARALCRHCAASVHCPYLVSQIETLRGVPFLFHAIRGKALWFGGDKEAFDREETRLKTDSGEPLELDLNDLLSILWERQEALFGAIKGLFLDRGGPSVPPEVIRAARALGVPPEASVEEITKAYRKAAFETHPDRGGSQERFKAVVQAREILLRYAERPR